MPIKHGARRALEFASCWALAAALAAAAVACAGSKPPGGDDEGTDGGPGGDGWVPPPPPDAFVCSSGAETGGLTFEKIATWRDDVKAAYSMIHDDMCGPGLEGIQDLAVPALAAHQMRAGLAPFVEVCEDLGWGVVQAAEASGQEILSHSYTHPEITMANAAHEVTEAKQAFDQHIQHPISFFVFPYDFFTAQTIAAVGAAGHIGARAGNRDDNDGFDHPPINSSEPGVDLEIEFDVWPRSYSKYALFRDQDLLWVHVWNAIEVGGWAVREFHSVISDDEQHPEERGFGPVPISIYNAHLDDLQKAWDAGQVWTDTPSTIIRYRHARKACRASVDGDVITFDASAEECTKFATPISVIVTTGNDVAGLTATQGGEAVAVRKLAASRFSVTADPTKGDVMVSGCGMEGPTVDPSIELRPKPMPAPSVCDLQTVRGSGSPGQMDNLERPPEQFQVLPNPSQRDGRTGTWSWYPQQARVEMKADGANHVLHYFASGLAAWTGATLAFLGGNGAGSCYDASAYRGVRFKIKGNVSATDTLNGKVIVSLVTAETQSRRYGGDLAGEGGHFHKIISVPSSWQTVSIMFSELERPTWGDTMSLPAVAVGKLQAIDWGISNTATTFDVSIDDIELF